MCVVFRVFAADGVMARHSAAAQRAPFEVPVGKLMNHNGTRFAVLLNMACWEIHKLYTYSPYSI